MDELTSADLPLSPSEEVITWVTRNRMNSAHAMLYRSARWRDPLTDLVEDCVEVICTGCEEKALLPKVRAGNCHNNIARAPFGFYDWKGQSVIHGESTMCPYCGATGQAVHIGAFRDEFILANTWPLEVRAIKGRLVLICWYISRRMGKAGREYIVTFPYEAYVVEKRKINLFVGYTKYFTQLTFNERWEQRKKYSDRFGKLEYCVPWDAKILEGTTAENSKLNRYMKCRGDLYPVSYLRLWLKRPHVENLLMAGAGNILAEMIRRDCQVYHGPVHIPKLQDVNWKEKRPAQMLGLTKEEFRFVREGKWDLRQLDIFRALKKQGEAIDPVKDMEQVKLLGYYDVNRIIKGAANAPVMRSVRYLLKQRKACGSSASAETLLDYWRMAAANGADLNNPEVRFPQNLKRAHDQEAQRQRFIKQAGQLAAFEQRAAILDRLSFAADGLLIRPVHDPEELYQEGAKLHHCVYSYASRHAEGKTAIFLIRREDAPDEPFFTLELDEMNLSVRQNRGLRNCGRTKPVQDFQDKWLAWAMANESKGAKTA